MCNVLSLFLVGTYYLEYFCNSFLVAVKTTPLKFGFSLKTRSKISKGFALPHTTLHTIYLLVVSNLKSNLVFLVALHKMALAMCLWLVKKSSTILQKTMKKGGKKTDR